MKRAVEQRPEERLFSQAIACEQQFLPADVVHGEREHAVEPFDAPRPVLLVGVHDDFGVARRPEAMTARDEPLPQHVVVVDFAVEDDPAGSVLVRHRLRTALAIDDRQPRVAERGGRIGEATLAVGTTMVERARHRANRIANRRIQLAVSRDHAANATHVRYPASRS